MLEDAKRYQVSSQKHYIPTVTTVSHKNAEGVNTSEMSVLNAVSSANTREYSFPM
jgi:hypothetical protein